MTTTDAGGHRRSGRGLVCFFWAAGTGDNPSRPPLPFPGSDMYSPKRRSLLGGKGEGGREFCVASGFFHPTFQQMRARDPVAVPFLLLPFYFILVFLVF